MSEDRHFFVFIGYLILSICINHASSAILGWSAFAISLILHAVFIKGDGNGNQ